MRAHPLFLLLLTALLPQPRAEAVSVYLHRTAVIDREEVTLGDVAAVVGDPAAVARLQGLPLWRSSGKLELAPAAFVKRCLAAELRGSVAVVGASVGVVPRRLADSGALPSAGSGDDGLGFCRRLFALVEALPGARIGRIEVEFLTVPPAAAAGQAAQLELTGPLDRGGPPAYVGGTYALAVHLPVGASAADTGMGAGAGGLRLRQLATVAFAAKDLPAGHVLAPEDVSFRETDVAALAGGFLTEEDHPASFRTVGPVARGTCLDRSRLERNYLVRAGQKVTVVFVRGNLRVSLPGRAFASGAAGDRIQVRAGAASRRFSARVYPSGEVVVEEL